MVKTAINKFRGYEIFAPAMIMPAAVTLASFDPERRLERGQGLEIKDPHHIVLGAIDWLSSQGYLKILDGQIKANEKGQTLFGLADAFKAYTSRYNSILAVLEVLLGWREGPVPRLPKIFENGSRFAFDALIPAAVTFFHECPSGSDPKVSVGAALLAAEGFEIKSEVSHSSMHWAKEDKRFKTIVTYVVQASVGHQTGALDDTALCA